MYKVTHCQALSISHLFSNQQLKFEATNANVIAETMITPPVEKRKELLLVLAVQRASTIKAPIRTKVANPAVRAQEKLFSVRTETKIPMQPQVTTERIKANPETVRNLSIILLFEKILKSAKNTKKKGRITMRLYKNHCTNAS